MRDGLQLIIGLSRIIAIQVGIIMIVIIIILII